MRLLKELAAAACGLAFVSTLGAAPADDIKALVEKGNARGAYELGRTTPSELGKPDFDFYFGLAAIDAGHAGEGVLALERYVTNFPDNLRARLELARGYFVLGEDLRAREEFNAVLRAGPPPAVAANVERYLDALRSRESAYKTTAGAFVELGIGYDSNINGGVSDSTVFGPGAGAAGVKTHANFTQLTAGANVIHPVAPGVSLLGSISGDFRAHDRHDEFDQGSLGIAGGISYLLEKNLFRGILAFSTLEVDHSRFRDTSGITGEWTHQLDELQSINGYLQYAELDYAGANDARDSRLQGLGLGYRRAFIGPWQPLVTIGGNYAREDNRRGNDFLNRSLWGVRAAVALTPAPKWALSAGVTYYDSDYDDDPAARRDKYYAADFSAGYALTRNFSVRGELLVSKNDSNLALNEYKREAFAVKLRYDFK